MDGIALPSAEFGHDSAVAGQTNSLLREELFVMSHEDEKAAVEMFMRILKTSEAEALAILAEGHTSLEEIAYVPLDELFEITGIEKARVAEIRDLARECLRASSE